MCCVGLACCSMCCGAGLNAADTACRQKKQHLQPSAHDNHGQKENIAWPMDHQHSPHKSEVMPVPMSSANLACK